MKRLFKWIGLVVIVLVVAVGAVAYSAFGHNRPIVDGQEPASGVRTVKDGFVSVFVLDAGKGQVALIDAGNDAAGKPILAELQRRGSSASAVAAIFLTHGHGDHTAGCKQFPAAEVYAMAADAPLIGDAAAIKHPLQDGEAVQIGDLRVEAFALPGHTPGSVAYLARGVLFFGDSAGGGKDGTVMRAVRLFSKDPAQNVVSLKALAARLQPRAAEVKTLAFAHSGPLEGFQPLADFASGK